MPKYQLSILHKILISAAVGVFGLTIVAIIGLGWLNWQNNRPSPISVAASNGNVISTSTDKVVESLAFEEPFRIAADSASLKWASNELLLLNGTSGTIDQGAVKLSQGKALLVVSANSAIVVQDQAMTATDLVAIIDIPRATVAIFAGSLSINGTTLTTGNEVSLVNTTTTAIFNRNLLISDQGLSLLRQLAINAGTATNSLSDVTPPQLTNILPRNGSTVDTQDLSVTAAVDDVNAEVTINGIQVANRNGQISYSLRLKEGDNVFSVSLADSNGNIATTELVYRYLKKAAASSTSTSSQP